MTDANEKQAPATQEAVVTAKRSSTSPTDEKASISQHDVESFDKDAEFGGPEARRKLERKLLLKVDARMSIMVLIYILNYLDRNNIAAARLRGLQEDLNLSNTEYSTCLSILYVGYILMQIPSNMIINKISRPSWYIAAAVRLHLASKKLSC